MWERSLSKVRWLSCVTSMNCYVLEMYHTNTNNITNSNPGKIHYECLILSHNCKNAYKEMPISRGASAIVVTISGMFYSASAFSSKCEKK